MNGAESVSVIFLFQAPSKICAARSKASSSDDPLSSSNANSSSSSLLAISSAFLFVGAVLVTAIGRFRVGSTDDASSPTSRSVVCLIQQDAFDDRIDAMDLRLQ